MKSRGIKETTAFTLLLACFISNSAYAQNQEECSRTENSYLWKIDVSPPVYLFGTMHVPYTRLWEFIPENVKTAFSSSEELCLELELLDQDTLRKLSRCRLLPSGSRVDDILSEKLVDRITNYLDLIKKALPKWLHPSGSSFLLGGAQSSENLFQTFVGDWKQLRPVWILYLLGSLTEERTRLNQLPVLDTFLERAAHQLEKGVEAIEEAEDQCRPFNRLPVNRIELALQVQLDYLETLIGESSFDGPRVTLEDNINSYRCGDFSDVVNNTPLLPIPSLDDINATSPYLTEEKLSMLRKAEGSLYRQLVVKRNKKMAQRIQELLELPDRNKTFFVGLGAGHFLTKRNSVIARLQKQGYIIEHIPVDMQLNGSSLPDNFVALGDPSSVSRLLHIEEESPEPSPPHGILSPERLEEIFNKHIPNHGTPQTSTTASLPGRQARSYVPMRSQVEIHPIKEFQRIVRKRLPQLSHSATPPTSSARSNYSFCPIIVSAWLLLRTVFLANDVLS